MTFSSRSLHRISRLRNLLELRVGEATVVCIALSIFMAQPAHAATTLFSSVLPTSRSVVVGQTATLFATVINAGVEEAINCRIEPDPSVDVSFSYRTTDSLTNLPVGEVNTPADVAPGEIASFVISLASDNEQPVVDFKPRFLCDNAPLVAPIIGVNTFTYSAALDPVPDVIALSATPSADGVVVLPQRASANAFGVATINLGSSGLIRASAEVTGSVLPVSVSLCETDAVSSQCINPTIPVAGPIELSMETGGTNTFGLFVSGADDLPFDPSQNRVFVRFRDDSDAVRGASSVAFRTRQRSPNEPLQLIESIAERVPRLPLRTLPMLLALEAEVLDGAIGIAQSGNEEILSSCDTSGNVRWQLDDRDANRRFSDGDVVIGEFDSCDFGLDAGYSGVIEFSVDTVGTSADESWLLGGAVAITQQLASVGDGEMTIVEGGFQFQFESGSDSTGGSITINQIDSVESVPFSLTGSASSESVSLSNMAFNLRGAPNGSTTHSFEGDFSSSTLGGRVTCVLESVVSDWFADSPKSGALRCTGLEEAELRLTGIDSATGDAGDLLLDQVGSGEFLAVQQGVLWTSFSTGNVFDAPFSGLLQEPLTIPVPTSAQREIVVGAMLINPVTDELYVANSAGLVILDPVTLDIIETVSLPGNVGTMELSANGSRLFFGYDNRSEIQEMTVATRVLEPPLALGQNPSQQDLFAEDIELHPSDPELMAVSLFIKNSSRPHAGVTVFQSGVRLPEMTRDISGANQIAFGQQGRLFGLDTEESSVRELLLSDSGVSEGEILDEFSVRSRSFFDVSGDLLVTGTLPTRFVNFDERRIDGQLTRFGGEFGSYIALDENDTRVWSVGRDLITYDLSTYSVVGRNRMSVFGSVVTALTTATSIIVAEDNRISVVEKAEIPDNAPTLCAPRVSEGISYFPCDIVDAVYASSSAKFISSIPSSAGAQGNSVMSIDAASASIDGFVHVGSEPSEIVLNSDQSKLFVALDGSNVVAELALGSEVISNSEPLLEGGRNLSPLFAELFAAAPNSSGELLVHTDSQNSSDALRFVSNGEVAAVDPQRFLPSLVSMTYSSSDSSRVLATGFSDFFTFTLDSGVISGSTETNDLFGGQFASGGGFLYSKDGRRLDVSTLSVESQYPVSAADVVGYQASEDRVIFGFSSGLVEVYGGAGGELIHSLFVQGLSGREITKIVAGPEGAMILTRNSGGWFIPNVLLEGS